MEHLPEFMQSNQAIGLGIASVIFVITLILASRKVIGFISTIILLGIAILASLLISHQHFFKVEELEPFPQNAEESADFKAQILQAINNIHAEIEQEKEALKKVTDGMQGLMTQMDVQKQKFQSFIEETRERFSKIKSDHTISSEEQVPLEDSDQ